MQTSVREILAEVDKDNDGRIDYQEFCDMMRGQVRVRASEALICAKSFTSVLVSHVAPTTFRMTDLSRLSG